MLGMTVPGVFLCCSAAATQAPRDVKDVTSDWAKFKNKKPNQNTIHSATTVTFHSFAT